MNINLGFTARKSKIAEKLLEEAAAAHIAVYRLRAEAKQKYEVGNPGLQYVTGLLNKLEVYINNSTGFFEVLEDEIAVNSIVGVRALADMERVRDRLNERIEIAKQTGNVVSFMKYKEMKNKPKGA
jgi:hypothetical protein